VRSIAVVVLSGVVTATVLFVLTSHSPVYGYLGPLCATRTVVHPGFDPWTGEPHGRTYECKSFDGSAITLVTDKAPDELIDRRAVPLPVGFVVGVFFALVWLTVASVADRRASPFKGPVAPQ
jgi:hypothetical protein